MLALDGVNLADLVLTEEMAELQQVLPVGAAGVFSGTALDRQVIHEGVDQVFHRDEL